MPGSWLNAHIGIIASLIGTPNAVSAQPHSSSADVLSCSSYAVLASGMCRWAELWEIGASRLNTKLQHVLLYKVPFPLTLHSFFSFRHVNKKKIYHPERQGGTS